MSNLFPLFILKQAEKTYMVNNFIQLVELKTGETYNGTL